MDGTKYSARFFKQMFTIYGLKNGNYIQLIFCLLPNKTTKTYIHAFHLILQKCTSLIVTLLPQYVTAVFENLFNLFDSLNKKYPGEGIKSNSLDIKVSLNKQTMLASNICLNCF